MTSYSSNLTTQLADIPNGSEGEGFQMIRNAEGSEGQTVKNRRIERWQKIADAADFSDPRIEQTIRRWPHVTPTIHARQWEFAMAFLALESAGMLRGDQRGISFGSGQEPLIFPVATDAGHLTVTDLYSGSTSWDVARTDDCRAFVLAAAPPDFDASRLDVRSLDMRHIDYPDASFDFAYSISAFEHIGRDNDFLKHLRGVRRILKPDGVYVLTTELRFGERSYEIEGNYIFALRHLLDLFRKAGLNPENRFDHRLTEIGENRPRDSRESKFHDASNPLDDQMLVRDVGGMLSTPGVFVLRPQPYEEPEVVGVAESRKWLFEQLALRTAYRFSDWCTLNPFGATADSRSPYVDLWPSEKAMQGPTVFGTAYHHFGTGPMEARVTLTTSPDKISNGSLSAAVMSWSVDDPRDMISLNGQDVAFDGAGAKHLRFRFNAESNRCYSLFGSHIAGEIALSDIAIYVRRIPPEEAKQMDVVNTRSKFSLARSLKRRLRRLLQS